MSEHDHVPLGQGPQNLRALDRFIYQGVADGTIDIPGFDVEAASSYSQQWQADIDYARVIFRAGESTPETVQVKGALYEIISRVISQTVSDWREKYPGISESAIAEFTKYSSLADEEVRGAARQAHGINEAGLTGLRPRFRQHAARAFETYGDTLVSQQIRKGLLDVPPFQPQVGLSGCMRGCYGMIFRAIAGDSFEVPDQYAIGELAEYGGTRFSEDILFRSLASRLFRQKTGRLVTSRVIIGADFTDIARRAEHVKQALPEASVHAIVGIQSFDEMAPAGLHAVVLLDADEEQVTFHNPYTRLHRQGCNSVGADECGAFDSIGKREFSARWAAAAHDTRLVISRPTPANSNS